MKNALLVIPALLAAMLISGCASSEPASSASASPFPSTTLPSAKDQAASPGPSGFVFTQENMPRMDGSTATIPLIEAVRSVLLGRPREDAAVSGTDDAYMQLINGNVDLLLVYGPAQDTLDYADQQKVELEMTPIGKDALVFLVNVANPVDDLTGQEIVDIYTGKITNWSEVGGEHTPVKAFQRQLLSGSQTMMNKLVMKGREMAAAPEGYVIGDMGGLVDAIATYDNADYAIGYNVYYYVTRMKLDDRIHLMSVDGVAPSNDSIASGEYPFVSDFYVVIRADAKPGSPERILYNWMLTDDGQALVIHEGYVANRAD